MAHCKELDLVDCKDLLTELRKLDFIREKSFGCFYVKAKSTVHFHKTHSRRFIHVWNGRDWIEIDLNEPMNQ